MALRPGFLASPSVAMQPDPGVPGRHLSMEGHHGQLVAMVPSKKAVIVRLG